MNRCEETEYVLSEEKKIANKPWQNFLTNLSSLSFAPPNCLHYIVSVLKSLFDTSSTPGLT